MSELEIHYLGILTYPANTSEIHDNKNNISKCVLFTNHLPHRGDVIENGKAHSVLKLQIPPVVSGVVSHLHLATSPQSQEKIVC